MNLGLKTGLLGGACALALVAFGVPAYAQDDIVTLRQQLDAMKERLAKLEADKQEKRRVAAAAAVEAGDKPRSWKLPGTNTSMNIGGFVKFTANWTFQGVRGAGSPTGDASAFYGLHAVPGSAAENAFNGGHFAFTARRSRIWFQTWTPTDWGELRTYLEFDFAGTAGAGTETPRLRHAYGTLGPVLVGQTWSTVAAPFSWPEALDDGGFPLGLNPNARVAQVRYTHNFGGGLTAELALESPEWPGAGVTSDVIVGGALGAQITPVLVAAVEWVQPTFRVRVAGFVHTIEHDSGGPTGPGAQQSDDITIGWGVAGGFSWTSPIPRLTVGGTFFGGYGAGHLLGYADAFLVSRNNLDNVWSWGGFAHVAYGITDTIRVNGGFGYHGQDCKDGNAARSVTCAATGLANFSDEWVAFGNVLWNPVPQVTFGVEYIHGFSKRYTVQGPNISRVQFAAIYRF